MKKACFLASIIVVVCLAVYFNALFNGFVYDDIPQVVENPWITDIRHVPDMFSNPVWGFQKEFSANYYRPFMHCIFMLSYYIFGLAPWGFHLVNILFHAGVSVLVFVIASRLLDREGGGTPPLHASFLSPGFIAALLFAVHPIHTEAVTWISGLPEVSFTFFCLLSFYLFVRSSGFGLSYALSVFFFSLAAFCKETALALPLLLVAYDVFFRRPFLSKPAGEIWLAYLKKYTPYFAVIGVYFIMRMRALGGFAPVNLHKDLDTFQIVLNIFPIFSQYLEKLFLPTLAKHPPIGVLVEHQPSRQSEPQ